MKIIRFNEKGHCQFIWFNWRKFRFETTCWCEDIGKLFGNTKDKSHKFIGLYQKPKEL